MADEASGKLAASLKSVYASRKLNITYVSDVVVSAMEIAESLENMPGWRKKEIVVHGVTQFVDDTDMLGPSETLVLRAVPHMIDNLIAADQHRLKIHPNVKKAGLWLFGICGKKNSN